MPTALITLRNGYTYAATQVTREHGWVRAECRRYMKTGPNNERTRFYGDLRWRSWPRDAVREVQAVKSSGGGAEDVSAAPAAS